MRGELHSSQVCFPFPSILSASKTHFINALAIFSRFYAGRALDIRTNVFPEWKRLPNGTFEAGRLSHTDQLFFDDDIVECTLPV